MALRPCFGLQRPTNWYWKSYKVLSKVAMCWGVYVHVCTEYSTQLLMPSCRVHCSLGPQESKLHSVWCMWEGRRDGRTDRQTPKCSHQPRKSGCCGNGSHCGSSHTRIEGHRCHHPRRTPGHTDKSLHKALCRVLNWMGPDRLQGRLYHRSYNGYSVGRKWLIGERKKNDWQWRTYFYI